MPIEPAPPPPQNVPDQQPGPNGSANVGLLARLVRPFTLVFASAVRRPVRFLLVLLAIGAGCGAAAALTVHQWFRYHLRLAQDATDRWHNAEAGDHLMRCRRVNPDQPQVLLLTARVARRTASWDVAAVSLERYLSVHGNDDAVAFEMLLTRAYQGDLNETQTALQYHLRTGGERARLTREAVINGLLIQYQYVAAQSLLADWLDESPNDPVALLIRGRFLEAQSGYEAALAEYQRVLELDPDLLEARLRLASLYVHRRLGAEALAETAVLRERLPNLVQVRVLHSKALLLQGKQEAAKVEMDECLRLFPDDAEALAEHGTQLLGAGDEAGAARDLGRAVERDPGNISAHSQYAFALARLGEQAKSQQEYDLVKRLQADVERTATIVRGPLQQNPRDVNLLFELGEICVRAGQPREAVRWFSKVLEINPDHLPSHRSLTVLYRQLDNPVLAGQHRANVQRLTPSAPKP